MKLLAIAKPDAVRCNYGIRVIGDLEARGYIVHRLGFAKLSETFIRELYVEHAEKEWFDRQLRFMLSGASLVAEITGPEPVHTKSSIRQRLRGNGHDLEAQRWGKAANWLHLSDGVNEGIREVELSRRFVA